MNFSSTSLRGIVISGRYSFYEGYRLVLQGVIDNLTGAKTFSNSLNRRRYSAWLPGHRCTGILQFGIICRHEVLFEPYFVLLRRRGIRSSAKVTEQMGSSARMRCSTPSKMGGRLRSVSYPESLLQPWLTPETIQGVTNTLPAHA